MTFWWFMLTAVMSRLLLPQYGWMFADSAVVAFLLTEILVWSIRFSHGCSPQASGHLKLLLDLCMMMGRLCEGRKRWLEFYIGFIKQTWEDFCLFLFTFVLIH